MLFPGRQPAIAISMTTHCTHCLHTNELTIERNSFRSFAQTSFPIAAVDKVSNFELLGTLTLAFVVAALIANDTFELLNYE